MVLSNNNSTAFQLHQNLSVKNIRSNFFHHRLSKITVGIHSIKHHIPHNQRRPFISENIQNGADRGKNEIQFFSSPYKITNPVAYYK